MSQKLATKYSLNSQLNQIKKKIRIRTLMSGIRPRPSLRRLRRSRTATGVLLPGARTLLLLRGPGLRTTEAVPTHLEERMELEDLLLIGEEAKMIMGAETMTNRGFLPKKKKRKLKLMLSLCILTE